MAKLFIVTIFTVFPARRTGPFSTANHLCEGEKKESFFVDRAELDAAADPSARDSDSNGSENKGLDAVIDYQPETVGNRLVLLPYEARVHVEEGSGVQNGEPNVLRSLPLVRRGVDRLLRCRRFAGRERASSEKPGVAA